MRVYITRRTVLDLLLSDHPKDCLTCRDQLYGQWRALAEEKGMPSTRYAGEPST